MPMKKYSCKNFAMCDRALNGEVLEVADGAEPECLHPECMKFLEEIVPPASRWKKLAVAAAGLLITLGGVLGYFQWFSDPAKSPELVAQSCDTKAMENAYKTGDCPMVVKLGEGCLANLPNDPTILNNVATCLLRSGNTDRARTLLDRAIAVRPEDPYLRYNLACVSAREKKKDDAVHSLKEACRLGLAPANFRQDPDLGSLAGYESFEDLVTNKKCE